MWNNFTTAIFTRHPLSRLFSCYNDKLVGLNPGQSRIFGEHVNKLIRKNVTKYSQCYDDITFEEFVRTVIFKIRKNPSKANNHYRPMFVSCNPCKVNFDVLGHLETIENDLELFKDVARRKGDIDLKISTHFTREYYFKEKCRQFQLKNLSPFPKHKSHCNSESVILKAKLKCIWNKGYLREFGFSEEVFKKIPKSEWFHKCKELVKNIKTNPKLKIAMKKAARERVRLAYFNLPKEIFKQTVKIYRKDFEIFDYDPQEIFSEEKNDEVKS